MTEPTAAESLGPASVATGPIAADLGGNAKLNRGGISWSIFEGARDPYVILITIYVFMPYVSASMVGDPVKGQELISRFQQYTGWIVMATAPFLGASIDKLGPRKLWLALAVIAMVPLIFSLWFAKPDGSGLSIMTTMTISMVVGVLFAYTEVLHNSMLIRAAGLKGAHSASGLALSLGNAASVVALGFSAWAFALPGKVNWTWVPHAPLFGLNAATHEPERVVAILSAVVLAVGAIPIFLFTPDAPKTGVPALRAFAQGASDLWSMLRTVRKYRDAVVFLAARMLFFDGMNGVLFFFGVLAAGVMHWGPLDLLLTGIILSIVAVFGGMVGRWLDHNLGPKRALQIEIFMTILGLMALLGTSPTQILWFWPYDASAHAPLWNGPVYRTLPDLMYLLIGFNNAIFITGQYASSRTALTRLTPPAQTGAFFGVYALSGVATAWLAPTLVNIGTKMTHSQQGGFASIVLLLSIGLIGLTFVKGGGREVTETA
ncbi:MFS transporter [Phenylobacterium sp.]|uniref:MFS transporter n=1 Tax=Phenylobacterium sp. TaxID=1871053 RepID=UPI00374CBF92